MKRFRFCGSDQVVEWQNRCLNPSYSHCFFFLTCAIGKRSQGTSLPWDPELLSMYSFLKFIMIVQPMRLRTQLPNALSLAVDLVANGLITWGRSWARYTVKHFLEVSAVSLQGTKKEKGTNDTKIIFYFLGLQVNCYSLMNHIVFKRWFINMSMYSLKVKNIPPKVIYPFYSNMNITF